MKALLALEDGRIFEGETFGALGETSGEVVFNTGMSGYQEILTDPSYHRQIVTMTYPLIGNTGVNSEDEESEKPQAAGFVIKEPSRIPSNFRCRKSLNEYLDESGMVAISGIDTRALTRHIRSAGAMRGIISNKTGSPEELVKKARNVAPIKGLDMVAEVTRKQKTEFNEGLWQLGQGFAQKQQPRQLPGETTVKGIHVAALDLGIKRNILRHLGQRAGRVTILPASSSAEEILALKPDGLFLSNGPGDPDAAPYVRETVRALIGKLPIFGICLGHQILCLSLGAKTFKMKFGHRGINHPVMDIESGGVVRITSQNHGFAVDEDSLPEELELTHYSLNDRTVEGVRHKEFPVFSVQYHPEASPGPHDTTGHFDRFIKQMENGGG
ncbi:MAG: carbamoyl-phosphate synthase small chain [bacterium]|nr:MAG: carbamoyl-phosphate synthase small chain [bacterium]